MAIEGRLQDMSVVDIIQLNCRNREEALVTVRNGDQEGTIYFADGQVIHAVQDEEVGQEAVYRLLKWEEGRFVIEKGVESPKDSINVPWSTLLMQNLHRIDEERGVEAQEAGDDGLLRELADRLDGFVAAAAIDADGEPLSHLVLEEDFDVEKAIRSLSGMVTQVSKTLEAAEAGTFKEAITITSGYRFIIRPIGDQQAYVQIILDSAGNVGAARMYLAAYLPDRGEELLEKGGGHIDDSQAGDVRVEDGPVFEFELE